MGTILPVGNTEQNMKDAEAILKLSKRWKKGMWKSVLKGAFFTLITVAVLLLVLYIFVGIKIT